MRSKRKTRKTQPQRSRRARRWFRRIFFLFLVVLAADEGLSLLVGHSRLNRRLTARLEAAFGRPVEVGGYSFSLLGGPSIEAESITVGEDPRFGHEYFLRAQGLTAHLRWQALLRGKIELGTLSFTRPSLNLVRAADGRWNIEDWLPRPSDAMTSGTPSGTTGRAAAPRLLRIDVGGGRLNFKLGDVKLPLALVDVNGRVEQESPGRWRIDLQARPARAAVVVQEAGTLHVLGHVGGTSSRLRPAELELAWQAASLSDVLRLARGSDSGLRGLLTLVLNARTEGPQWSFAVRAEMRRLHGWNLPLRADNPAVNLSLSARLWPEKFRLEMTQAILEAPRSSLRATGLLGWARPANSRGSPPVDAQLQLLSSSIQLSDLLSWLRAFQPGVAEELQLHGKLGMDVTLRGWPLRVEQGTVMTEGVELGGGNLGVPLRMGRATLRLVQDRLDLPQVTINLGDRAGALRLEATARRRAGWIFDAKTVGQVDHVQDLFQTAEALGWSLPRGWRVEGPAHFELRWKGEPFPFRVEALGKIDLGGLSLRVPFLNRPLTQVKGIIELRPAERRITLSSAQAFGASWSGTLSRRVAAGGWSFTLDADRLSAAELDRWLDPRWREGLLQQVLPLLGPAAEIQTLPAGLRGSGRLSVEQVTIEPLVLRHLRAQASLDGRSLQLSGAQADFYGGTASGSLRAEFSAEPDYRVEAKLERVNLSALADSTATLKGRFAGFASSEVQLQARGTGRATLAATLAGHGTAEVRDAEFRGIDLLGSFRVAGRQSGTSSFTVASARFIVGEGKVGINPLHFAGTEMELEGSGSVDFSRRVDLRLHELPPVLAVKGSSDPESLRVVPKVTFRLTGTIDAPQSLRLEAEAPPR